MLRIMKFAMTDKTMAEAARGTGDLDQRLAFTENKIKETAELLERYDKKSPRDKSDRAKFERIRTWELER